jgi:nucleoside 2-deoxyribosyltransferase
MTHFNIYLAGPIENATIEEMSWWRKGIIDEMQLYPVNFLDPTRREPVHLQSRYALTGNQRRNLYNQIMTQDLMDIDRSDLIFANIRSVDGRGIGTAMEIMYASLQRKPIIAWSGKDDQHHPFYESLVTEKHHNLDEAIEAMRSYVK